MARLSSPAPDWKRTLLVAVKQEAGAVKVVVNGPRLLKVHPDREDREVDIVFVGRKTK